MVFTGLRLRNAIKELIKTTTARLVAVPFYSFIILPYYYPTVVGNANEKFILTPTVAMNGLTLLSALFLWLLVSYENGVSEAKESKRQTTNRQWIPKNEKFLCPSDPVTQYDALGRRQSGYLVPPGYQGFCGSCWAFAGAHTFADQININSNSLVAMFSPDHVARCSPYNSNHNGCCGGMLHEAALFFSKIGAYPESCYPYTLENYRKDIARTDDARIQHKINNPLMCPSTCENGDSSPTPQKLFGYTTIENTTAEVIAALNNGPLYMTMSIGQGTTNLQHYGCGVFTDPIPFRPSENYHAVEIVDYSSSSYSGTPFYVVKNSWGSSWGEQGYFRIAQNSQHLCDFVDFTAGSNSSSEEMTVPISQSTCSPVEVNVALVSDFVTFALEQLNSLKLLTCIAGGGMPTVQRTSVINATEQVVAGMITEVTLRVAVTGCEEDSAILQVVVLQNMNDSFTLLDYSYSTTSAAVLHIHSLGLLLVLMVFIFGLNFL